MTDTRPRRSLVRRLLPWVVGAGILALVISRIPLSAFREAIDQGPHVQLGLATIAITTTVLFTDTFATWVGLRALDVVRPISRVLFVRGATYVLFLVNYAVGQGAFGFYLNRTGVSAPRAVGITLFLLGTNLAALLLLTTIAWAIDGPTVLFPALWWSLVIGSGGFGLYLVIIAIRPRFLAERAVLAPLFDCGMRGYALALVGRLPHTIVIVLGHWVALRVWGIPAPFWAGVTLMPAVAIASVLPISPAGLGTTQAAFVVFFGAFATGDPAMRDAHVLAFAIVYFVYGVLASLLVGLACTPFARKMGVMPPPAVIEDAAKS